MMSHARYALHRTITRKLVSVRRINAISNALNHITSFSTLPQVNQPTLSSPVDAEPLDRYKKGGYHPMTLGSVLANGRYKILHKAGWGGYSTVWVARDQREETYVAIKICVSEGESCRSQRELDTLKKLRATHPGSRHVMHMLDHFDVEGPNGTHRCLVLELLGPSVPDLIEARFADGRLPGPLARATAKQALLGLDLLHDQGIAHGDLHTGNLAFAISPMNPTPMPESEIKNLLGKPETGHVHRNDSKSLGPGIPEYIVRPASTWKWTWPISDATIKIIDFGESFSQQNVPRTLHTPLALRAPEVIFQDRLDYRVDLWTLGCMLFELFVGQPPFDSLFTTPSILVGQMHEIIGEAVPARWMGKWEAMRDGANVESPGPGLQEWLLEVYFDGERKEDLTKDDTLKLGRIIQRLLRFEPSARASVKELLDDPWFRD
ncbi:serine protein kinase [Aspergillus homomorphus CBS 101889]|uniref:Serine protein kinase n=1 Tax=Aspergillus homomorphus (strain CBS 101889) TaxID=1450537 RepID=A0A395IAG5_ASPHC|nr:serine protein kinase [Aspergillus homomorphus CBS 101889]RAL17202.1 serine protein kinase [Aspergillus homomorphus CBS 101889]